MENYLLIVLGSLGVVVLTTVFLVVGKKKNSKELSEQYMNELIKEEERKKSKKKDNKVQKKIQPQNQSKFNSLVVLITQRMTLVMIKKKITKTYFV